MEAVSAGLRTPRKLCPGQPAARGTLSNNKLKLMRSSARAEKLTSVLASSRCRMKSRNSRASKNKREVNDIKSANSLHAPPTSGEPKYMRTRSQLSTQLSSRRCLCPSNGQSMRWILGHCRVTGQQRTNRCTMLSRKVRSQIFTSSRRRHPLGAEKDLKSHRPAFLETDPRGDSRSIILTATRRSGPAPPASTL